MTSKQTHRNAMKNPINTSRHADQTDWQAHAQFHYRIFLNALSYNLHIRQRTYISIISYIWIHVLDLSVCLSIMSNKNICWLRFFSSLLITHTVISGSFIECNPNKRDCCNSKVITQGVYSVPTRALASALTIYRE